MLPVGIYGVGKAALHPPALAVLSHTPDGATQTIAWVGKGIVYDTGGLSIKGKVRCWPLRQSRVQKSRGVHGSQVLEEDGQELGVGELGSGREIVDPVLLLRGIVTCPTSDRGLETESLDRIQKQAAGVIKGWVRRTGGAACKESGVSVCVKMNEQVSRD